MQRRLAIVTTPVRFRRVPVLLAALLFAIPAAAQVAKLPPMVTYPEGQKVKISGGVIVDRSGDILRVREGDRALHLVVLTPDTKIYSPAGLLKSDKIHRDSSALLPGLMLTVHGRGDASGRVMAEEIHFSSTSLRTAQQIQIGQETLKNQVAANTDSIELNKRRVRDSLLRVNARIMNIDEFDEKFVRVVNFATGSAELTAQSRAILDDVVERSDVLKGYLIEVTGYADTTGTEAINRPLSTRRADAVVAYLTEVRHVPIRRMLNPTGHGSARAIATNTTPDGRAMNRRAQIRVLVNRTLSAKKPR